MVKTDTNEAAVDEQEVIDPSSTEDEEVETSVRYTISSYGADYPVDGLVKRLSQKDIYVPPFQRGFVWTHAQASRFVESLLLGLPVPGIFLFKESDTQRLLVVDGQQRLRTLEKFFDGVIRGKEFALRGVCRELNNVTYKSLRDEDRRRFDDAIIHATIFQQDNPTDQLGSIYLIFERLNSGGTPLAPQEIRSCVYRGSFNELLEELADNQNWREIYGPPSARGKDQELILRFFALLKNQGQYERPMKGFLNNFMEINRHADEKQIKQLKDTFEATMEIAASHLTRSAFRPERNLNAAVLDAFLVGLSRRLDHGEIKKPERLSTAAADTLKNVDFLTAVKSTTTAPASISNRIQIASDAFSAVP